MTRDSRAMSRSILMQARLSRGAVAASRTICNRIATSSRLDHEFSRNASEICSGRKRLARFSGKSVLAIIAVELSGVNFILSA